MVKKKTAFIYPTIFLMKYIEYIINFIFSNFHELWKYILIDIVNFLKNFKIQRKF